MTGALHSQTTSSNREILARQPGSIQKLANVLMRCNPAHDAGSRSCHDPEFIVGDEIKKGKCSISGSITNRNLQPTWMRGTEYLQNAMSLYANKKGIPAVCCD